MSGGIVVADSGPIHYLGVIDLPRRIAALRNTNFFAPPELLAGALQRDRERRKQ